MSRQKIILNDVRLSFPSLMQTETYNGQDTGKYAATFLIPKGTEQAKMIKEAEKAIFQGFGKKVKTCIKDGDSEDITYDGYAGHWAIKCNTKRKPVVLNRDKTPIEDIEEICYAGCYVNASIELYPLDNQYGKRVCGQLNGIQFVKDGEPFVKGGLEDDDFGHIGEAKTNNAFSEYEAQASEPNPFDDDIAF